MKKKPIIIRDRYQITIPEELRTELSWIKTNTMINAYAKNGKLIIEPSTQKDGDKSWEEFMKDMQMVRELLKPYNDGKDSTDLINEDRESH